MRMFKIYGEGTRHLTRGQAAAYRLWRRWFHCSTGDTGQAEYRREKLRQFEQSRKEGLSVSSSLMVAGVAKSALYRWRGNYARYGLDGLADVSRARRTVQPRRARTAALVNRIRAIRKSAPWGKAILTDLLRREGVETGETSVGKVIRELRAAGKICGSGSGKWYRHSRQFGRSWRRRRSRRPLARCPGWLQLDHMKVSMATGYAIVVFAARDVYSNAIFCMSASNAAAATATRFLNKLASDLPFGIRDIQADGGSEFRGEFEAACQAAALPLNVIPRRSPKRNSKIENANGTRQREVFNFLNNIELSIGGVQLALDRFTLRYNRQRPNLALSYRDDRKRLRCLTPWEYINAFYQSSGTSPP